MYWVLVSPSDLFVFGVFQAGSIEGQVMEMGLTTTSLLNPEKFPVIVPNSLFSSQVCNIIALASRHAFIRLVFWKLSLTDC